MMSSFFYKTIFNLNVNHLSERGTGNRRILQIDPSMCMCGQPTAGELLLMKSDVEEKGGAGVEVGGKAACRGSSKNRQAKAA